MMREPVKFAVGILALLPWTFVTVAQGTLGFLKDAPIAHLNDDDRRMLREAATAVLESPEPGTTRTWENSATGSGGEIRALSRFDTADGRECRRLNFQTHTKKGGDSALKMNVCRDPSGKWLMDPEARPASQEKS